jgi:uncharacterized protein YkwD
VTISGQLATQHSASMAEHKTLSHGEFNQRFSQSGASLCVENVGWNFPAAGQMVAAWRNSSGHDKKMLRRNISRAGVGEVDGYVTFFACN